MNESKSTGHLATNWVISDDGSNQAHAGRFVVSLGSSAFEWVKVLRFALLTKFEGVAATAVGLVTRAGRAEHEFSELRGAAESVADIMLALKSLRFSLPDGVSRRRLELKFMGRVKVTSDALATAEVKVLTPGVALFELTQDDAELTLELVVQRDRGESLASERPASETPPGLLPLDAMFSPVLVADVWPSGSTDVKVEVTTDGSISARTALEQAVAALVS